MSPLYHGSIFDKENQSILAAAKRQSRRSRVPGGPSVPENPVEAYNREKQDADFEELVSSSGLSTSHISPLDVPVFRSKRQAVEFQASRDKALDGNKGHSPHAIIWQGGSLLTVKRDAQKCLAPYVKGSIRGRASFSRKSRLRLLHLLAKLQREKLPVFVTLTYPGEWDENDRKWKRDLDAFGKRFERQFPDAGFVWKLEFQKRGAPHYHLLVYGADYAHLRAWVDKNWYEVVGSGDERHLRAGTGVEPIYSQRGVMAYAAKYLGKEQQGRKDVGRFWGVIGRDNLPFALQTPLLLSDRDVVELMRLMRRFAKIKRTMRGSLSVICDADQWLYKCDQFWRGGAYNVSKPAFG